MTDHAGFDFTGDNQTLVIPADDLYAYVNSNHYANASLVNYGYVFTPGDAVFFSGNGGSITNNPHGVIYSGASGIDVEGDYEKIFNYGSVTGLSSLTQSGGVFMGEQSNHVIVVNDGTIFGRHAGIEAYSSLDGGKITNTGDEIIASDHDGIIVYTKTGLTTTITNGANATIRGTDHAIFINLGAIALTNYGKLIGGIDSGIGSGAAAAHDIIVNHGTIVGSVGLGAGNDRYDGRGGGVVTGIIYGGPGHDTFFAGAGKDTFAFHSAAESPAGTTRDVIFDFTPGTDNIDLRWFALDYYRQAHFVYIGADTFAHYHAVHPATVGMLRFAAGQHLLQGNVDTNFANAEFEISLPGVTALGLGDFVGVLHA